MADTGAGPSQKKRKLNEEQLKAKRESDRCQVTGEKLSQSGF